MTLNELREHIPVFSEYIDADIMLQASYALDEIAVKVAKLHEDILEVLRPIVYADAEARDFGE